MGGLSIDINGVFAAVMPGGHTVRTEFEGGLEKQVKFDFSVAQHIRVRCPACGVFVEHVVDDALFVLGGEVEDLKGDAEVRGHKHGIVGIVNPGALIVDDDRFIVPVAHEDADDFMAFLLQKPRGHA